MSECTCNHRNEGGEERPEEKNRAVSGVRGLFALSPVMVLLVVYLAVIRPLLKTATSETKPPELLEGELRDRELDKRERLPLDGFVFEGKWRQPIKK